MYQRTGATHAPCGSQLRVRLSRTISRVQQLHPGFACNGAGVGKEQHQLLDKGQLLGALPSNWWQSGGLRAGRMGGERHRDGHRT